RLKGHRIRRRRDLDDLDEAGDLPRFCGVVGGDFAPHDGRARDDGVLHAGQPDILTIYRATGRDIETVDDVDAFLADIAELRWILEAQAADGRNVLLGRVGGELPEAERLSDRLLDDLVVPRFYVGDWNAPTFRCGLLQHHTGRGAGLAHRH